MNSTTPTLASESSIIAVERTSFPTAIIPTIAPSINTSTHEEKKFCGKNLEKKEDVQLVNAYLTTSRGTEISTDTPA